MKLTGQKFLEMKDEVASTMKAEHPKARIVDRVSTLIDDNWEALKQQGV